MLGAAADSRQGTCEALAFGCRRPAGGCCSSLSQMAGGCYSPARTWVGGEELKQAKSTAAADFSTSTTASTLRRSLSFERFRKKKSDASPAAPDKTTAPMRRSLSFGRVAMPSKGAEIQQVSSKLPLASGKLPLVARRPLAALAGPSVLRLLVTTERASLHRPVRCAHARRCSAGAGGRGGGAAAHGRAQSAARPAAHDARVQPVPPHAWRP